MLKLIAPLSRKRPFRIGDQDTDSESENISIARTSTPVKTTTATNSKTTQVISRNTTVKAKNPWVLNPSSTTMPTIGGETAKFKRIEDLLQSSLKVYPKI